MSYKTNIRLLLKNTNAKGYGTLNFEITFIHKTTKKKIRRYFNINEKLHKDDLRRYGIKQGERYKKLALLIERKKLNLTEQLHSIEIDNGEISPQLYDYSIRVSGDIKKDIFQLFDMFLEFKKSKVDEKTIKKYKSLRHALNEFVQGGKTKSIYLSDITIDFLERFTAFLADERDLSVNTINKYQSSLNAFLDYLTNTIKLNKNLEYREFQKTPRNREDGSRVVLLKEHVEAIISWEPPNERFEKVKDLFLFQILTGLRFSDLTRLNKSWVKKDKLSFKMLKSPKTVNIPLHNTAKEILTKYNYEIGAICKSIKNYNLDLKLMAEKAGLTETISDLKITLTKKIPLESRLCDLISSHVGRSTFVTNLIISGVSPYIIISYTGHSKVSTLDYYFKLAGDIDTVAFQKFQSYFNF